MANIVTTGFLHLAGVAFGAALGMEFPKKVESTMQLTCPPAEVGEILANSHFTAATGDVACLYVKTYGMVGKTRRGELAPLKPTR